MPAAKPTPRTADNHEAIPPISDAEWVVMTEFWRLGEATAKDVVQTLKGRQAWKPKTVQTLINRLVQKGALGFRQQGREYVYLPGWRRTGACMRPAGPLWIVSLAGSSLLCWPVFWKGRSARPQSWRRCASSWNCNRSN
nr:BlaI/MecI/CopY family transcriptional regulator [Verrucomicrobium spinosum]